MKLPDSGFLLQIMLLSGWGGDLRAFRMPTGCV